MYVDVYENTDSRIVIEMDKTTAWGFIQRVAEMLELSDEELQATYDELFADFV